MISNINSPTITLFNDYLYLNKALVIQPIILFGVLYRKYENSIKNINFLIYGILILVLNFVIGQEIEISKNLFYGVIGFYPMTIIGLLFCISLAKSLMNYDKIKCFSEYIGQRTFAIMALHFAVFKSIDGVIGLINKDISAETLQLFPISFPKIRILYFICGVIVPCLFFDFVVCIKRSLALKSDR